MGVCSRWPIQLEKRMPLPGGVAMSVDGAGARPADAASGRRRQEQSVSSRLPFLAAIAEICRVAAEQGRPFDAVAGDFNTPEPQHRLRRLEETRVTTWPAGRQPAGAGPFRRFCPSMISIMSGWARGSAAIVHVLYWAVFRPSRTVCQRVADRCGGQPPDRAARPTGSSAMGHSSRGFTASGSLDGLGFPDGESQGLQDDEDHQDRRNQVSDVNRPVKAQRRAGKSKQHGERVRRSRSCSPSTS